MEIWKIQKGEPNQTSRYETTQVKNALDGINGRLDTAGKMEKWLINYNNENYTK